jgi:hypothetical protein
MDETINNVIKLPITKSQRYRNKLGKLAAQCIVSERWLKFEQEYTSYGGNDLITLDVMTLDITESPRKLCQLILNRQDLEQALHKIKKKS